MTPNFETLQDICKDCGSSVKDLSGRRVRRFILAVNSVTNAGPNLSEGR